MSLPDALREPRFAVRDSDGVAVLLPILGVSSLDSGRSFGGGLFSSGSSGLAVTLSPHKHIDAPLCRAGVFLHIALPSATGFTLMDGPVSSQ